MRRWVLGILLGVLVGLTTGCATSGQRGNVTFAYRNVDQSGRAARQPIAAGSELDIQLSPASGNGSAAEFSVQGASSSNHEVLKIVSVETGERGDFVRVRALKPGRAELSVQTTAGTDVVELLVQEVGEVSIYHWLEVLGGDSLDEEDIALLRGGAAQFRVSKRSTSGAELAGRGPDTHVDVRPKAGATVETPAGASRQLHVTVESGGSVTLRGKPRGDSSTFDVVDVENLAALNLVSPRLPIEKSERSGAVATHPITFAEAARNERFPRVDTLSADDQAWLLAVATFADGRRAVGLDGLLETKSETPEICSVRPASRASVGLFGGGLALVEAKRRGTCRIAATLGSAKANYSFVVVE